MANSVILPLFVMLSDPDFINQAVIWLVTTLFFFVTPFLIAITVFKGSKFA